MLPLRDRLTSRRVPVVNYILLGINIWVFVWERLTIDSGVAPERLLQEWGLVPLYLSRFPIERFFSVFTSMFMHDPYNLMHLGSNMLFLWIFGDNVEDALGHPRYALFYLGSGLSAAALQYFIDPLSRIPMVGASGAISGVLAAYAFLYPRSPVTVLNPVLPLWLFFGATFLLPAWLVILEFFLVNLLSGLGSLSNGGAARGGVAFFAHLGGFIGGAVLLALLRPPKPKRPYDPWSGFRNPGRY